MKRLRGRWVQWYKLIDDTEPEVEEDVPASRLLDELLVKYGEQTASGRSRVNVINGIIGGKLRDRANMSPGVMLGVLRFHISQDPEWQEMVLDPGFERFLKARIVELLKRDGRY